LILSLGTAESWLHEMSTPICAIASRVLIVSFQGLSRRFLPSVLTSTRRASSAVMYEMVWRRLLFPPRDLEGSISSRLRILNTVCFNRPLCSAKSFTAIRGSFMLEVTPNVGGNRRAAPMLASEKARVGASG
jgi:hypothetical protein